MASITYGLCKNLSWLAILAKEKGLFRGENLDIDFRFFPTGRTAAQALQKGWVDVANVIDANVAYLALEKKPKIRLLYSLQVKDDAGILARRESGISVPADLVGRKVAYLPKTSSHMFLVKFCDFHGVDMNRMDLTVMTPEQMPDALLRGEIDAFSVWEPFRINTRMAAAQADTALCYFRNDCGYKFYVVLGATEKAALKKKADIEKTVEALRKASAFALAQPEEAHRILADNYGLSLPLFAQMRDSVTLRVEDIPRDFIDQVQTQMLWLEPDLDNSYENILTGLCAG